MKAGGGVFFLKKKSVMARTRDAPFLWSVSQEGSISFANCHHSSYDSYIKLITTSPCVIRTVTRGEHVSTDTKSKQEAMRRVVCVYCKEVGMLYRQEEEE